MKRIVMTIVVLAASLALASCGGGKIVYDSPAGGRLPATGRSWTVLVYMCGGSGETEHRTASDKLKSIMSVDYPENVRVVVQTGGSSDWGMKGVYGDYNQRFEAGKGTLYLADQSMSENMGDYRTLSSFLSWGISNYPADNYMLVLSGAGGGALNGMAYDENFGDDSLNIEEISYAVSLAGRSFDIICLDAPLMGSIETAAALSTSTAYLVAPQAMQNGDTWDYAAMLNCVCGNPSAAPEDICKVICDGYYASSERNKTAADTAMSVIDMSKVSTLNQAFDGMAGEMLVSTDQMSSYISMTDAVKTAHTYGGAATDEGYSNLIDLGDAAMKISPLVGNTADAVMEALNDAVIYRVCGENERESTGLGMYYPLSPDNDELQTYMNNAVSVNYKEFLRKICINCSVEDTMSNTADYTSSWSWVCYDSAMRELQYMTVLDNNSYELHITGDMNVIKDVSVNVYKEKDGSYVFLGNHHDLEGDFASGVFKDAFDGRMPRLISKEITMSLVRDYGDCAIYSVPVILNGERGSVRVKRSAEGGYEIVGAWSGADANGKVTSTLNKLTMFDRITPLLEVYDEEHKTVNYISGSPGMKFGGKVTENTVDNGEYLFEFEITDIYGGKRHGTPVHAHISGGKVTFE